MTDFAMTFLLLVLMAYSVTGQAVHEWLGITLLALIVLHLLLNLRWIRAVRRGRYPVAKILQSLLAVLLFFSMAAQITSGVAMSRHTLPFVNIPIPTSLARQIHLACGYWSFLLASLHLGVHWDVFIAIGRKPWGGGAVSPVGRIALRMVAGAAATYGAVCFIQQNIADYLFLRTEFAYFDYEKSSMWIMGELMAIMVLEVLIGRFLQYSSKKF